MFKKVIFSCCIAAAAFAVDEGDFDEAEIDELIEAVDLADVEDLDDDMLEELLALDFDEDDGDYDYDDEEDYLDTITAGFGADEEDYEEIS